MTIDQQRKELVNGLRDLAQFLEDHSQVPCEYPEITYHVQASHDSEGIAQVADLAGVLGVEVTGSGMTRCPLQLDSTHFYACRVFGPVVYRAIYVRSQAMAEHRAHEAEDDCHCLPVWLDEYAQAVKRAGGAR